MQGLLDDNHAVVANDFERDTEDLFLPVFGVYHQKNVGKYDVYFFIG